MLPHVLHAFHSHQAAGCYRATATLSTPLFLFAKKLLKNNLSVLNIHPALINNDINKVCQSWVKYAT